MNDIPDKKLPSVLMSSLPIVALVVLLYIVVKIFDTAALEGASQLAIMISSAFCVAIGMIIYKIPWDSFEDGIRSNIANVSTAIVMLLLIGAIGSTWMLSGIVPTMIYYGLHLLEPKFFILICCVTSAIVSVMTGSSWTTIATVGVALMGIGQGMGLPAPWLAGAIISGAYFGDKMSPLSDTTIIASSSSGTPLFEHIKYLMITTVPSMLITLLIFLIAGFSFSYAPESCTMSFIQALEESFNINIWLLLIPLATITMIIMKWSSLIVLFISALLACAVIPFAQPQLISQIIDIEGEMTLLNYIESMLIASYGSTSIITTDDMLTELVSTRGMAGMLNTIWLIITAMVFGGVMIGSGMITSITNYIMKFVKSTFLLVSSTLLTGIFCNICISDQYLSIILTTNIFKNYYKENGYESRLLSRTVEDSATTTSVLVPWNTCGMTQASVLNVATLEYLPYCFFNILSPIMSLVVVALGYKIFRKKPNTEHI